MSEHRLMQKKTSSSRTPTKRRRSSITELAFHGIHTSRPKKAKSVTHVSGTKCHLCLGPLNLVYLPKFTGPLERAAFLLRAASRYCAPTEPPTRRNCAFDCLKA